MVVELLLVVEVETMMRSGRKLKLGERWRRIFLYYDVQARCVADQPTKDVVFFQLIPYVLLYYDVYFFLI